MVWRWQRPAERGAVEDVAAGEGQAVVGQPEPHGAEQDPLELEGRHDLVEATVHLAEHLVLRHEALVEDDLAGHRRSPAHLLQRRAERQTGVVGVDHERGDPPPPGVPLGLDRDEQHVRQAGVGDEKNGTLYLYFDVGQTESGRGVTNVWMATHQGLLNN